MALQHLRASTANKRPTPAAMANGQLAMNTNLASPGLFFKDSNGDLVKTGPVHVGTTAPNAIPASGGQAGNSKGELRLDTTGSDYTLKTWDGSAWREIVVTSTMIKDGTIVNADINASAAIVDTKLATISTAGKVSNSATTATNANTASAIVARDGSGNFSAGTVTAALTGAASANVLKAGDTMTGVLAVTAGTAALPAITPSGDPNTGIYSPGADQLAISTNGTGRLFVDANGNVTVGASATSNQSLRINSTGNNYLELSTAGATGEHKITAGNSASGTAQLVFETASGGVETERMRLDSTGRLGLGTSSPAAVLHVSETSGTSAIFERTGSNGSFIGLKDASGSFSYLGTNNGVFSVQTSGSGYSDKLVVTAAGNVGIGTTSPAVALHVNGSAALGTAQNLSWGGAYGAGIPTIAGSASGLDFYPTGSTTGLNMRIDASGRLLVGTSSARGNFYNSTVSAGIQLEGTGTNRRAAIIGDDFEGVLILASQKSGTVGGNQVLANNDPIGAVTFQGSDGTEFVEAASITVAVDGTPGANDMPGRLVFSTTADGASSPTERMRIKNDGQTYWVSSDPTTTSYGTSIGRAGLPGLFETYRNAGATNSVVNAGGNAGQVVVYGDGDLENTNNRYTGFSDIRLKQNIEDSGSQWDDIKNVRVRKYELISDPSRRQIGVIAQELELTSPGLVVERGDDTTGETHKSVAYSVLYMKAVKALQEAMDRIETLEAKVAALEAA